MATFTDSSLDTSVIAWTKNIVYYALDAAVDWDTFDTYYIKCRIGQRLGGVDLPYFVEVQQTPDPDGRLVFEVQEYFDTYIEKNYGLSALPEYDQVTITQTDLPIEFWIEFTERAGVTDTVVGTKYALAIPAGLDFEDFSYPTQYDWLFREKRWLTSVGDPKRTACGVQEYLYFLCKTDNVPNVDVVVTLFYSDETSATITPFANFPHGDKVLLIPTGYQALNLSAYDFANNPIYQYTVQLYIPGTSTQVSTPIRYELTDRPYLEKRQYLYRNSLGGYDTVLADGRLEDSISSKKTIYQRAIRYDYNYRRGQYFVGLQDGVRNGSVGTGWLSADYADSLQDFAISKQVFELKNGQFLPVKLDIDQKYYEKDSDLLGYVFVYEYLWNIDLYTRIKRNNSAPTPPPVPCLYDVFFVVSSDCQAVTPPPNPAIPPPTQPPGSIACGAAAFSGGAGETYYEFDLLPAGGWIAFDISTYQQVDKAEIIHNGVKRATTYFFEESLGVYPPFANNYGPFDNSVPYDAGYPNADQYIGTAKNFYYGRLAEFTADTGASIAGSFTPGEFQRIWFKYTPADYAAANKCYLLISGVIGTGWTLKRVCP